MTVAVLLIDDDADRADVSRLALEAYGFEVTLSDNATGAIGRFLAEPHDVVLVVAGALQGQGLMVADAIRNSPGGLDCGMVLWLDDDSPGQTLADYPIADAVLKPESDALYLRTVLVEVAHDKTGATLDALVVNAPQLQLRSGSRRQKVSPPQPPMVAEIESDDFEVLETIITPPPATPPPATPPAPDPAASWPYPVQGTLLELPVRDLLLQAARARLSGTVTFSRADDHAKVALVRGIIMGATDTDPETRLGSRLMRRKKIEERQLNEAVALSQSQGIRLAEALVQLGALSAGELLEELTEQSRERAVRVAGWNDGDYLVEFNLEAVEAISIAPFDILDVMLEWHLRRPEREKLYGWVRDHMDDELRVPPGQEHLLQAFRLALPDSRLPRVLEKGPRTLREALAGVSHGTSNDSQTRDRVMAELYGAWAATVFLLGSDGEVPSETLPLRLRKASEADEVGYDRDLAERVQEVWLRTQGRDFYAIVGATQSDAPQVLEAKVRAFQSKFGPEALRDANLGPVQHLASALAGLCAELDFVLTDQDRRESYTREITANFERAPITSEPAFDAEIDEAEAAMNAGDFDIAKATLLRLQDNAPDNARLGANLAFIEVQQRVTEATVAMRALEEVCARTKGRGRTLYLLGRAQYMLGLHVDAMRSLSEASRNAPDDPLIESALADVVRALAKL